MLLRNITCLIVLLLSLNLEISGQDKTAHTKVDHLNDSALNHIKNGELMEARVLFNQLLVIYSESNEIEKYYRIRKSQARSYYYEGRSDLMKSSINESLEYCRLNHSDQSFEYALLTHEKGIYYLISSELDSGIIAVKHALKLIKNTKGKLDFEYTKYLNDIGVMYYRKNNFLAALDYYQESRDLNYELNKEYTRGVAVADSNIGEIYLNYGDFDSAIEKFYKSLDYYVSTGNEKGRHAAQLYTDLGTCYSRKNLFGKGEEYHLKALDTWRGLYGKEHLKVGYAHRMLANTYNSKGDSEKAIFHINKAVNILEETTGVSSIESIEAYISKSVIQMDSKSYKDAEHTNLDLITRFSGTPKENLISNAYLNLSLTYFKMGDGINAEKYALEAEEAYGKNEKSPVLLAKALNAIGKSKILQGQFVEADSIIMGALMEGYGAASFNDVNLQNVNITSFYGIAEASLLNTLTAYEKTKEVRWLYRGDSLVDDISTSLEAHLFKLGRKDLADILKRQHELSQYILPIIEHLYSQTQDIHYLERFIEFQDKGKSHLILSNMSKNDLYKMKDIPDSLIQKEKQLNLEISLAKRNNEVDKSIALFGELEVVISKLASYESDYRDDVISRTSLKTLQSYLGSNEALIQYSIFEQTLYVSLVSSASVHIFQEDLTDQFSDEVLFKIDNIKAKKKLPNKKLKELLLGKVLAEIEPEINTLHIVKDGVLNYVPFEVFQDSEEKYLVEKYTICYQLSFEHMIRSKDKEPSYGRILAFSPTFMQNCTPLASKYKEITRGDLSNLKGAGNEVDYLVSNFAATGFTDSMATETMLRKELGNYNYLHFATHAILDDDNPEYSKLVFASDSLSDGYLHAYEIYNMSLSSELLTLSACNTGFGQIKEGEGVMSLSHAFAYAGSPNIVMSLWPVNDESTAELMAYFYQNLKEGMRKDEALREAKLTYLENADPVKAHPYYWAGFVFSGDPSSIDLIDNTLKLWMVGTIGFLLIIAFMVYKRTFLKVG